MRFFLMSQGSLDLEIRFLCQKVCSVARVQTDTQTDTKVNTEDTISGFHDFLSTYHQGSVQYQSFLTPMAASFFTQLKMSR